MSVSPPPTASQSGYNNSLISKVLGNVAAAQPAKGRGLRLFFEAVLYTSCGLLIANAFQVQQSGFFAIFLGAAGLTPRFGEILDENRRDIFNRGRSSLQANAQSVFSVLALFLGAFSVFAVAALWTGEVRMSRTFGFVLEVARLGNDTIVTRAFSSAPSLFAHNALVLAAFFALALVYRIYGALLALFWNACIWGLVLAFLVRREMVATAVHPVLFAVGSAVAVLPHLVLEAAAYVVGSLAAIFLSKGLLKHSPSEPAFRSVMIAVAMLSLISLGCLLLSAVIEASLPRLVLSQLRR